MFTTRTKTAEGRKHPDTQAQLEETRVCVFVRDWQRAASRCKTTASGQQLSENCWLTIVVAHARTRATVKHDKAFLTRIAAFFLPSCKKILGLDLHHLIITKEWAPSGILHREDTAPSAGAEGHVKHKTAPIDVFEIRDYSFVFLLIFCLCLWLCWTYIRRNTICSGLNSRKLVSICHISAKIEFTCSKFLW